MKDPRRNSGSRRLVVCLGPGGVGKTTLSAALALGAALDGTTVDVMTVDPAPRLLDALGLRVGAEAAAPHRVSLAGLNAKAGGRLSVMKLDSKRVFDRLVERHAPSPAARDAILSDRIYRNLSNALAGVADYMAMEQLLELHQNHPRDLIVLDTPPAREALDFLDAPQRMLDLLNSRAITLLGASRQMMRTPLALFDLAARAVLAAFDRLTQMHLLADVQAFVRRFDGMYAGFAERAAAAQALVRDAQTRIIVVTTPESDRIEQVCDFLTSLERMGLQIHAVAVNRVMPPVPDMAEVEHANLPRALKHKVIRNLNDFAALYSRQAGVLTELRGRLPRGTAMMTVPDLGYEPRTLKDLAKIAATLRVEELE